MWLKMYWIHAIIRVCRALDRLSSVSGSKVVPKKGNLPGFPLSNFLKFGHNVGTRNGRKSI